MNKKIVAKFFIVGLGLFMLSSCSLYPFGSVEREPVIEQESQDNLSEESAVVLPADNPEDMPVSIPPVIKESSTASSSVVEPEAGLSAQVIREYERGTDYDLIFSPGYFVSDPVVSEISCDFAKACPCVRNNGYADEKDFCTRIAPSSRTVVNKENYCVQKWSEGAAGSTYTSYVYVKNLPDFYGHCVAMQFTKRFVTDCKVFDGADAAKERADCEAEKTAAPAAIKNVITSLKIIPVQAVQ